MPGLKAADMPAQIAGADAPRLAVSPNPTNPATTVSFRLGDPEDVGLEVYDLRGRLVARLAEGILAAGDHQARWDGTDVAGRRVPSGTYVLRLRTGSAIQTQRLTLVR